MLAEAAADGSRDSSVCEQVNADKSRLGKARHWTLEVERAWFGRGEVRMLDGGWNGSQGLVCSRSRGIL
jgi:hypothetical protein